MKRSRRCGATTRAAGRFVQSVLAAAGLFPALWAGLLLGEVQAQPTPGSASPAPGSASPGSASPGAAAPGSASAAAPGSASAAAPGASAAAPAGSSTGDAAASGAAQPGWPTHETVQMPAEGQSLSDLPPPPWASIRDVPNPAFLDTTDRRIVDERPPPTEEQVAALRELEREVERFSRVGRAYRRSIDSILRREYTHRRRAQEAGYSRQIQEEERLEGEARERAIALFEAFIRRYPDDPRYTPDAMFRLGELYYERSALEFQDAEGDEALDRPDFQPTITLYRDLIARFPQYRRIDGAFYLVGYCLNEMGEMEEARAAWLTLVCANHFHYSGPVAHGSAGEVEAPDDEAHPALSLDGTPTADAGPFVDPYEGCEPVIPSARFVTEVWLRVGEYHFDMDYGAHGLSRAISAYSKVLTHEEDRNYNLALYKVAWTYYRASRYPEAIAHFARLVEWSDRQQALTGRAGSELRAEALQYLGIAFAYDDWNENQLPDTDEGMPSGIARLQDPSLMSQDRPWTVEVYFQLGQVYYEEAKYPEAVAVWDLALGRWPNHHRVPEIIASMARAYQRNQQLDRALAAQARLADYREGSAWWSANMDHPMEQRRAEELAEGALVQDAVRHHRQAQQLRQEAIRERNTDTLDRALAEYNLAATAYRNYLGTYPNSPNAYELQYNLADALFWSEQYEEAARVYAGVRDSNLDDTYLSESARRVVESLRRVSDAAKERGDLALREQAPDAAGNPPRVNPIEMPVLVQRLAQAREVYLARVPEAADRENVRAAYDYNNALLLYAYGYWPQARQRFLSIYEGRCSGPNADETGEVAWESLYNMAVAVNDRDEVERLSRDVRRRGCTFSSEVASVDASTQEDFCQQSGNREHPLCRSGRVLNTVKFQRALTVFSQAERAEGDAQRQLYERSATMLVRAVEDDPDHPQAPLALLQAALALERTQRFDSAGRLYQRVIEKVSPIEDRARRTELDGILGTSYFRLAYTANRFFDYERAVENYRAIADSERFAASQDPDMPARITDSLINAARILEYQQQYPRAASYYARAAEALADGAEKRNARYRVAEMAYKAENWNVALRQMRAFINQYGSDPSAGELVVQAFWRLAQIRRRLRQVRDRARALQNVVSAFDRMQLQPGTMGAEYAANSRFQLVDPSIRPLEQLAVNPGRARTTQAFVTELTRQIQSGSRKVQRVVEGYEPIFAYRRPTWTIAALARQGRAYEILARAVLNTSVVMPSDLQRRIRSASADVRDEVRIQFEDQVRQRLDEQVRPIECYGVVRYALAARAAQRGNIDSEYARLAIDRLQAYGDERIAECITTQRQQDASLEAYRPGEFTRARRGQHEEVRPGLAAPALAGEGS